MRRLALAALAAVAVVSLALTAGAASATPHQAGQARAAAVASDITRVGSSWTILNEGGGGCLRAHADNQPLQVGACNQTWQTIQDLNTGGKTYVLMLVNNTSLCWNNLFADSLAYANSCNGQDGNEYNWVTPCTAGGCQGQFWIITDHAGIYYTAQDHNANADVELLGPGNGDLATWGLACVSDC